MTSRGVINLMLLHSTRVSPLPLATPQKAAKYQKKYRKWLLFFLMFVVLLAGGICIYFFAVKK